MIGFFDIKNGCAGDMICAALAGCVDIKEIEKQLSKIKFPSRYKIEVVQTTRPSGSSHGIKANRFYVHITGKEHERSYLEIVSIFKNSKLPEESKQKILQVFKLLAEAESKVHRENLKDLHFHAVGQTDALVEVSFSVLAIQYLGIKRLFSSPVGISNPAPATMEMIKGIPVIVRNIPFEITTPTGIAIIKTLTQSCDDIPVFIPEGYSYGTGTMNTREPNTIQFIFGKESVDTNDTVSVIETSIDDMNPVIFEYLIEKLYKAGSLEVCFFTGITKKSRPVYWLRVLCRPSEKNSIFKIIFKETTTLGIRYREEARVKLERLEKNVKTKYGDIRIKAGYYANQVVNIMPEYEDCKRVALEKNVPLKKVIEEAIKSATAGKNEGNGL